MIDIRGLNTVVLVMDKMLSGKLSVKVAIYVELSQLSDFSSAVGML